MTKDFSASFIAFDAAQRAAFLRDRHDLLGAVNCSKTVKESFKMKFRNSVSLLQPLEAVLTEIVEFSNVESLGSVLAHVSAAYNIERSLSNFLHSQFLYGKDFAREYHYGPWDKNFQRREAFLAFEERQEEAQEARRFNELSDSNSDF